MNGNLHYAALPGYVEDSFALSTVSDTGCVECRFSFIR